MEPLDSAVRAHVIIGDPQAALLLIQKAKKEQEANADLWRLEINCLAAKEDIPALLQAYQTYCAIKQNKVDESLLEEIAWAILRKASTSPSPILRQEAVLAAFITNDAKSIPLCLKGLEDQNLDVRYLALRLAAQARDEEVNRKVFEIFTCSRQPSDRLAAISALKNLETAEVQKALTNLITTDTSPLVEKVAAVETLSKLLQSLDASQIAELLSSNRAMLRALACELVKDAQSKKLLPLIIPCLFDESQEVRLAALQCVGFTGGQKLIHYSSQEFLALVSHKDPKTAILANWLLLLENDPRARFDQYLLSSDREQALIAAACLAQAGPNGVPFMLLGIKASQDPLVRLNLAIGLIWQRKELQLAQNALITTLTNKQERLSWHHLGAISWVGQTVLSHVPNIQSLPETEDLLTRLELLKMLASCSTDNLREALIPLLKERTWGVTSQAAALMMQTGMDEGKETFETLRPLLDDKNPEVSLQAAFMLASYTQDEKALKVFETSYPTVSRQLKEMILVGIGQIGSKTSLPFLVDVLSSPFESLRVSAARSILLCLYN